MSSPAGRVGSIIAHVAYGVSKGGCLALMKSVAKAFAADGIRANAVLPGPTATPLRRSFGGACFASQAERPLLKRPASGREVADAVLYLVSDRSTYVTGHELWVDGGWSPG
jgi:NAD(P)-dependent dehydrogenase (short-subunit alcohol dehydrogenase family)